MLLSLSLSLSPLLSGKIAPSRRSTLAFNQDDQTYRLIGQIDGGPRFTIESRGFDPSAFILACAGGRIAASASSSSSGTSGQEMNRSARKHDERSFEREREREKG